MYNKTQQQKSDYFITKDNILIYSGYDKNKIPELVKCDFFNTQNNWKIKLSQSSGIITYFNDFLLIQDYDGTVSIINYTNGNIINDFLDYNFKISLPVNTNKLYNSKLNCYKGRIFERQFGLYDFISDEEIWGGENMNGFWIDELYIIKDSNYTIVTNPYFDKFNWHFSLESLNNVNPSLDWSKAEIFNFIKVIDGTLWMDVVVPNYGGVLLGLDTQTGSVKHLLTECLPMNDQLWYTLKTIPNYCLSRYDEGSNKIIGAARSIYWEVDLSEKTPIFKRWNFEKELEKYHAEFRPSTLDCAITPTYIITPVGGAIPRVVAFNRESHKIDWCHEFLEESTTIPDFMPQKAEATDTHLFVLISTGDLYIFEKTEDN